MRALVVLGSPELLRSGAASAWACAAIERRLQGVDVVFATEEMPMPPMVTVSTLARAAMFLVRWNADGTVTEHLGSALRVSHHWFAPASLSEHGALRLPGAPELPLLKSIADGVRARKVDPKVLVLVAPWGSACTGIIGTARGAGLPVEIQTCPEDLGPRSVDEPSP